MSKKIANKVMEMNKWQFKDKTSVMYKVSCSCGGGDECDITFEFNNDFGDLTLNFYKSVYLYNPHRNADKWWEHILKIIHNIKNSIKVLFGSRMTFEGDMMIQEEEHIADFIQALDEGKDYITHFKETNFGKEESSKKI